MLKIEEWAKDKPLWLAMFASQVVSSTDGLYYFCQLAFDETLVNRQKHPAHLEKWITMYTVPKAVYRELICNSLDIPPEAYEQNFKVIAQLKYGMPEAGQNRLNRIPEHKRNRVLIRIINKSIADCRLIYRELLADIRQDIAGKVEYDKERIAAYMAIPEVQFFFRVWIPCWLTYHTLPHVLFGKALSGDLKSLSRLINLDRFVLMHPGINGMYLKSKDTSPAWFEELSIRLQQKPEITIDMPKIKKICGAFLYYLSHEFAAKQKELEKQFPGLKLPKVALKMPDIQKLFDAYAKDSTGQYRDMDLPDRSDSFAKAIKRELPFWEGYLENWT